MSAETVADIASEPLSDDPITLERLALILSRIEGEVSQLMNFATMVANMLDAMGSNPMIAAMMPPGMLPQEE